MSDNLITLKEAGVIAHKHPITIRSWCLKGFKGKKCPHTRLGWSYYVNEHTFRGYLHEIGKMMRESVIA